MQYTVIVDAERTVTERYRITLDAPNREEALDIAWEVVSEPTTELKVDRCLRERQSTNNIEVLAAEIEEEGLVQDGVFEDDGA